MEAPLPAAIFELVLDRIFVNSDVPLSVLSRISSSLDDYRLLSGFVPSHRSPRLLTAELEGFPVQLDPLHFVSRFVDAVELSSVYRLHSASERSLEDQDVLRLVFRASSPCSS